MNSKNILILLSFVATASCFSFYSVVNEEWEAFKLEHGKQYDTEVEESFRMKIFAENKYKIARHNKLHNLGQKTYSLKMNEYGDMLHQEFVASMNGLKKMDLDEREALHQEEAVSFIEPDDNVILPDSVDWRTKGAVTDIKDQGQCGSCWAFSATGALEGQHFLKSGKLVSLSEQNLVDCTRSYGSRGCEGGLMTDAFKYIKDNNGIDTEASYPYEAVDEQCHFMRSEVGAVDKGYARIEFGNERALQKAVATVGPISLAIDASLQSFQFYHRGVYYEPSCSNDSLSLDHGVLAVGYGTDESGTPYWLVKNSWGTSWGLNGYIKMARNHGNNCGVATDATYPLV